MKLISSILTLITGLVFTATLLPAQTSDFSNVQLNLGAATDTQTLLAQLATVEPVAFASLPKDRLNRVAAAGFWSFQMHNWPPLPGNVLGLDVWPLGSGVFVLDDRNVDYAALQAAAELAAQLDEAATLKSSPTAMRMMSSSLTSYGHPVYLTNLVVTTSPMSASFDVAGGTNFVPYDLVMTTNLAAVNWTWLGIGYTSNRYSFSNQPSDMAFYRLAKPSRTMVVAWGDNSHGQSDVPLGLTNAVQIAGGYPQSVALLSDGTTQSWGDSSFTSRPTNFTGVAMLACGWNHNVVLFTNGTVTAWGFNGSVFGWNLTTVPPNLTNMAVISAQGLHSLALRKDGSVVSWGWSPAGETNVPAGLTNVSAIAAGGQHSLAVSNGYVIAWGNGSQGQCAVPTNLNQVVDVAAGWLHSVALKQNGTVVCWGDNRFGQTNTPVGLSNVVAIAAGGFGNQSGYTLALKQDGTVVGWGSPATPAGLQNVIAVAGGANHALVLRTGPATPVITQQPVDQFQVAGSNVTFRAQGQGLYAVTYQWQFNAVNLTGATNTTLSLTNVSSATEGAYRMIVTGNNALGNATSSPAYFSLVRPPVIAAQSPLPTNQVASFQTNLTLGVAATASGMTNGFPLSYQWRFNGTNIPYADTNYYTLLVEPRTLGNYSVVISNLAGSVTSLVWNVAITYAGTWIAPGTLAYHLSTNAVGRTNRISSDIYTGTFELANSQYKSYSGTNLYFLTNAVWSTNFWLKDVQGLSATSIGFSNGLGGQALVTMISPRHCIYANHVHLPPGYFMAAFLDTNNVIYWRTNVENIFINNDISVGVLNTELPDSVGYLAVLTTNFSQYLPTNSSAYIQGIGMNQDPRIIGQPMNLGDPNIVWSPTISVPFGLTTNWNVKIRGGDSSNPERLLIENQLVLVSHNFHVTDGPNYMFQVDAINQAMHYLSTNNGYTPDYQLKQFQITNWPTINH